MLICDNHPEYKVPLISTMAFPYCELWCPYCGLTAGMMDAGEKVEETEALIGRLSIYEEYSEFYLSAHGMLCCSSFELNGTRMKPKDMPKAMELELKEIASSGWKYEVKAMTLVRGDDRPKEMPKFSCSYCKLDNNKEKRCEDAYKTDVAICPKWEREEK